MARGWALWSLPRRVLIYVLAVDCAAVSVTAAFLWVCPAHPAQLRALAWIAACAAVSIEVTRHVERLRERHRETPYKTLDSVWVVPVLLLCGPGLVGLIVAGGYLLMWFRVKRFAPHRWIFSAAAAIVAGSLGGLVFRLIVPEASAGGALPSRPVVLPAAVAAGTVVMVVNLVLIGGVILMTDPRRSLRQVFGGGEEQTIEVTAISFGILVAAGYTVAPWATLLALPVALLLPRTLLLAHFQTAARTDAKTGLANATWWHELAEREVERARRLGEEVSLLIADLDHFKRVNDTYGHLAGDVVLREVARAFSAEVREYDIVGRFGGEEFVLILPATGLERALDIAERLRRRISLLAVPAPAGRNGEPLLIGALSVSIGLATLPDQADDLADLLRLADVALYAAKDAGRNRVRAAPPTASSSPDALLPPT